MDSQGRLCSEALRQHGGSTKGEPRRKRWADIDTDDEEDGFQPWLPVQQDLEEEGEKPAPLTLPLLWDPLGLKCPERASPLRRKSNESIDGTLGFGDAYDKWSWTTGATSSENASETEEVDEMSPSAASASPHPGSPSPRLLLSTAAPQREAKPVAVAQVHSAIMAPAGMIMAVPAPPVALPMVLPAVYGYPGYSMSAQGPPPRIWNAQEESNEANNYPVPQGLPFGHRHKFHKRSNTMGRLDDDGRGFTQGKNKGRLSIVSESRVHFEGVARYAVQFTDGELCSADGVGFVLSSDLPCTKNIQKIFSVFVNRTGRICIRAHEEVERCPQQVRQLEVGDWLEVMADMTYQTVAFTVWPQDGSAPSSATVSFQEAFSNGVGRLNGLPRKPCGYLTAVIKHPGVRVTFGS